MGTHLVLAGYLYIETYPKDVISDISPPLSRLHNFDIEELVQNYRMYMFVTTWAFRIHACRFPGPTLLQRKTKSVAEDRLRASDKGVKDA